MKTYSVKEIAEMLNTNPETVRRWIRDKKLDATIESKKGGHMISEPAFRAFLQTSPKYASIVAETLGRAAIIPTVIPAAIVGKLIARKLINSEQLKKAHISNNDMVRFLEGEANNCLEAIKTKESTIHQLEKQIEDDKKQLAEYQKLIDSLSVAEE